MKILTKVLYRSLWEDVVKILVKILWEAIAWSYTGPFRKILWRSYRHPTRAPCMILHGSVWEDLVEILAKPCLRGPRMILYRSFTGDLVEILVGSFLGGPCVKILQMPLYESSCWRLLESSCIKILYTMSFPEEAAAAAAGPFTKIFWDSLRGPGIKILAKVFALPCAKIL